MIIYLNLTFPFSGEKGRPSKRHKSSSKVFRNPPFDFIWILGFIYIFFFCRMSTRTRLLKMKMRIMVKSSKMIIEMVFGHLLDTQQIKSILDSDFYVCVLFLFV